MNRAENFVIKIVVLAMFLAGVTAYAEMPKGEYLEGKGSKIGVILAHGQGWDHDSLVTGT